MKSFIIPNPRERFVSLLVIDIVLLFASLLLLTQAQVRSSQSAPLGWLVVCSFLAGIPWLIQQIFEARPYLIADERGLWYRPFGLDFIPWKAIKAITVETVAGTKIIRLELDQPEIWLGKLPMAHSLIAQLNKAMGFPVFNLNLSRIGANTDEVFTRITEIQRRWQAKAQE